MIVSQKISDMISLELDQLIKIDHKSHYKRSIIDIYSGRLIDQTDVQENKNIPSVTRKVFVPDPVTRDSCTRMNKILLYGREPHPVSHGFERQRDQSTFIEPHRSKRRLLTIQLYEALERIGKRRIKAIAQNLLGLDAIRADYFARLITIRGRMAGGNPLSPQILNIQAYKMDRYLTDFCNKYRLTYTRYLDSLAFSSSVFIHTEVIAKIKRTISRCGWMIDNEQVDIQSGNHFHIAGQVIVPDHVLEKRKRTKGETAGKDQAVRNTFMTRRTLGSILKSVNPTEQIPKEQHLIRSLKSKLNRGSSSEENS